jgi:adenylosuccinate lyase
MPDFDNYLSPFTWRYGSLAMRQIWSETYKRRLWRRIWVALAQVEADYGFVSAEQLENLREHQDQVDIERALEIESSIHHDLMAELQTFTEQAPAGGGVLHLGATSMDIEDNADALRLRESLEQVISQLGNILIHLANSPATSRTNDIRIPISVFSPRSARRLGTPPLVTNSRQGFQRSGGHCLGLYTANRKQFLRHI